MNYRNVYGDVFLRNVDAVEARMYVRPGTDDDVAVDEVWNENVYRLHPDHVRDRVVVDVGANSGAFSLWAAASGASTVYAYEPEGDNFTALLDNMSGYSVVCINAALSDFEGKGRINGLESGTGSGTLVVGEDFKVLNFEEQLSKLKDVAVLKMDIEGSEYACFDAVTHETLSNVEKIVMEFHGPGMVRMPDDWKEDFGRMVTKIAEWGHVDILGRPSMGGMIYGVRY